MFFCKICCREINQFFVSYDEALHDGNVSSLDLSLEHLQNIDPLQKYDLKLMKRKIILTTNHFKLRQKIIINDVLLTYFELTNFFNLHAQDKNGKKNIKNLQIIL